MRDYRASGAVLGLPSQFARKAEALYLAGRTSDALDAINEAEALAERFENRYWSAELYRLRGVSLRLWVPTQPKLRPRSAQPSESHMSRSRFRWRNAQKQPTQNIAGKKRARQEEVDSDYLFANFLQLPAFRSPPRPRNPSPFSAELPDSSTVSV
jgi:hypothetical protein